MSIVVPIKSSDCWKSLLDSAIALSKLLPGSLDIVIGDDDEGFHSAAREYIMQSSANSMNDARLSNSTAVAGKLGRHNHRMSVLVVPADPNAGDFYSMYTEDSVPWRGPILLVPANLDERSQSYGDRVVILVSDDSGIESLEPWATWIAENGRGQVTLLTVLPSDDDHQLRRRLTFAESQLSQKAERLRRRSVRAAWEARVGNPPTEVGRFAETTGTSLVILQRPLRHAMEEQVLDLLVENGTLHVFLAI